MYSWFLFGQGLIGRPSGRLWREPGGGSDLLTHPASASQAARLALSLSPSTPSQASHGPTHGQ